MAHIRPEVLAAIREAQTIFRSRGRPLTPAMADALARGWLAARKEFDRAREIELEVLAELQAVWERHPELVVARLPILVERYPNLRVILSGNGPFGMSTAFWAQVRVG